MCSVDKWNQRPRDIGVRHRRSLIFRAVLRNVTDDCTKIGAGGEIGVRTPPEGNGRVGLVQHRVVGGGTESVELRVPRLCGFRTSISKLEHHSRKNERTLLVLAGPVARGK
jgi:hypothetical protein